MNPLRPVVRAGRRGQTLVEFTLVLPIILTLVLGATEIGMAIGNDMTLELATREGARVGASLVNGGGATGCGSGGSPNWTTVDPQIIASVERALRSPGSNVDMSHIDSIHIFKADTTGAEVAFNSWTYSAGSGPTVDGVQLDFVQGAVNWKACDRTSQLPATSIGVGIIYRYQMITPLAHFMGMVGVHEIVMSDSTVMALEPGQ